METYYRVSYKKKDGTPVTYTRDTVERGYYLYKSLLEDKDEEGITDLKLEEVSNSAIAHLRPINPYLKEEKVELPSKKEEKTTDWFSALTGGMSREEYNECLERFAAFHGATLSDWGL